MILETASAVAVVFVATALLFLVAANADLVFGGAPSAAAETPGYDPRYSEARSIEGAHARYREDDGYTVLDLEADLDRIMGEKDGEASVDELARRKLDDLAPGLDGQEAPR